VNPQRCSICNDTGRIEELVFDADGPRTVFYLCNCRAGVQLDRQLRDGIDARVRAKREEYESARKPMRRETINKRLEEFRATLQRRLPPFYDERSQGKPLPWVERNRRDHDAFIAWLKAYSPADYDAPDLPPEPAAPPVQPDIPLEDY